MTFAFRPIHHVQLAIPPGGEDLYSADPFGNRLEFLEPLQG